MNNWWMNMKLEEYRREDWLGQREQQRLAVKWDGARLISLGEWVAVFLVLAFVGLAMIRTY